MNEKIINYISIIIIGAVIALTMVGFAEAEEKAGMDLSAAYAAGKCETINEIHLMAKELGVSDNLVTVYVVSEARKFKATYKQYLIACKGILTKFAEDTNKINF